jgi:hypothetical protein
MDVLPKPQQRLWPQLRPATDLGFVLYGGTAIALRLGHRSSVDFDFFCDRPLNRPELIQGIPVLSSSTVIQDESNSLTFLVPDALSGHIKLSFFGDIGFGRVGVPEPTEDGTLCLASLDDLMATKLKVILQRAEAKDYRDIAAMVAAGVSLAKGLASARLFYGPNFQPSESLRALVFFEDGDLQELSRDEKSVLVHAASLVRELPSVALLSKRLT